MWAFAGFGVEVWSAGGEGKAVFTPLAFVKLQAFPVNVDLFIVCVEGTFYCLFDLLFFKKNATLARRAGCD